MSTSNYMIILMLGCSLYLESYKTNKTNMELISKHLTIVIDRMRTRDAYIRDANIIRVLYFIYIYNYKFLL